MIHVATAEKVLGTLHRNARTSPPPGLAPEYIDGFFARNREALLKALIARLERHAALARRTAGPTAWGGQRGLTALTHHQMGAGRRVVLVNSLLEWVHGTIVETPDGDRRVRLDSGASGWFPTLWPEVAPPAEVPRDIAVGEINGEVFGVLQPFDLWKRLRTLLRRSLREKQPTLQDGTRKNAVALWRLFHGWLTAHGRRPQWLSWSGRELRLLELWSSDTELQDGAVEKLELDWLLQLPDRYQERYLPGDRVRSVWFGGQGNPGRTSQEIPIERMTTSGVVHRREAHPYHYLEPLSTQPGMNTCLSPFEEPVRPMQVFDLLSAGSDWVELSPALLRAWIDLYLHEHRVEAHVQLLGERGGRLRLEPIDSRYDGRYLPLEVLNQVFLYLPKVEDDGIEIDLFQEEDVFDDALPFLRRPVQVHPAFIPSLARALVATAMQHGVPLNPSIRRCLPKSEPAQGEETASGGRKGALLVYSPLHKMDRGYVGTRVVTPEGLHGRIAWSTQRPGKNHDKIEVFQVRLDSGREVAREEIYLETARPKAVVPDVRVEGTYVEPGEVWTRVSMHYFWLLDQERVRRRNHRKESEAWEFLRVWFAAWRTWRRATPSASVQGFEPEAETRIEAFIQNASGTGSGVEAVRPG